MKSLFFLFLTFYNSRCSILIFNSSNQCSCSSQKTLCGSSSGKSTCTSLVQVNQSSLIQSISLNVSVTHGNTEEIIVSLIAPDGTTAILHNKFKGKNIKTIYPTLAVPYQSLDKFLGKNMSGVWVLEIKDTKGSSQKTKGIQWSLNFMPFTTYEDTTNYTTVAPIPTTTGAYLSPVNISELPMEQVIDILKSDQDITACLLNCSNHGQCVQTDSNLYICDCDEHYTGYTCNIDMRQCSSNPCLNSAKCNDLIDSEASYAFNCSCSQFHYGIYCENQVDVCANETCSNNGVCKNKNMTAVCECFQLYSGEKCEIESNKATLIKTTIKFTSILAISILLGFYLMFVLIDACRFYANRKKTVNEKSLKSKNKKMNRYIYKN
jgi:subtilisin-like proprotein convertase family protein